ncbi:MAG: CdaR family protein [Caldisericaceae bacterium]
MKKFLNFLLNIKFLSVIFAIALWYYVIGIQGPIIQKTFSQVNVIPINVSSDSFVVNNIGSVSVTAEGPSKIILGLKDSDFSAIVDLTGKKHGEYFLPVEVHSPLSNITVKDTAPSTVKVTLEQVSSIVLPVSADMINQPKDFLPQIPVISPSSVNVVGPQSTLSNIARIYVTVDLSSITGRTTLNLPISIAMKDGSIPTNIYLNPSTCVVIVDKSTANGSVTVPIIPVITGTPFSGFGLKGVSVAPLSITLNGDYSTLSSIASINTVPIDISKYTKPTSLQIDVAIPAGVKSATTNCTVKIDIEPLKTAQIKIPLTILHDDAKYASSTTDSVEVTVTGFADVVNSINPQLVSATVDATHLDVGSYTLPINVTNVPQGVTVNFVIPASCEVKIS